MDQRILIYDTRFTPALAYWLRESHDDGKPPLIVGQEGDHIEIRRSNGWDASDTERTKITAHLVAHAAEPLR